MNVDEMTKAQSMWLDPAHVRREIGAAELQRERILKPLEDMLRKFEGPGRDDTLASSYDRENHYFEWVSLVLPQVMFRNPRCMVTSKRPRVSAWDAVALKHAVNRWILDTDFHRTLERVGVDWCFSVGILMVTLEPYGGDFDDPKQRPRSIHIDPQQFGMDPLARSWEESRYMFHKCVEDKVSLVRRAKSEDGWNKKSVEALSTEQDVEGLGRPKGQDVNRNEVTYYEMWVPELSEGDDEEHHGMILTIGTCMSDEGKPESAFLRKPRRYYGPRWGPYTIFDAYHVPRSPWPMGPLQAHEGHVRELNLHAQANSISASRRKTIMVYDETDKTTAEAVLRAKDGEGVGIPGFLKQSFDIFSTPGVTEDALIYEQHKRGALERISGLNDRAKGETGGGASATADAIAARGSDARMSFLNEKLYRAIARHLRSVLWFYWHNDLIVEELPQEALEELANSGVQLEPGSVWQGGYNEGSSFDDLELEVEPYSMSRLDEAGMQQQWMQMFQIMLTAAPAIVQAPWMPWKDMFNKLGESSRWPDLGSGINMELANQVAAMMLQQQSIPENQATRSEGPKVASYAAGSGRGSNGGQPGMAPPRPSRPSEIGTKSANPMSGYSAGRNASKGAK